ncbi:hypothetical protein [Streptomyces sp. E-15]
MGIRPGHCLRLPQAVRRLDTVLTALAPHSDVSAVHHLRDRAAS